MSGRPVILVGCGRLGASLVQGWLGAGGLDPRDLIIVTPSTKPAAEAARAAGARINPEPSALAAADRVVLGVKPAMWREAAATILPALAPDALVISMMAGVRAEDLSAAFAPRAVVRVMPTTGVAAAAGVAALWAPDADSAARARALFASVAQVVDLPEESLIDAATAVAGSGQAYFFAFARGLAQAGREQGLSDEQALALARGALISAAAAARAEPDTPLSDLIARVASPGGTTQAALAVFDEAVSEETGALDALIARAAEAAARRAGELSRT